MAPATWILCSYRQDPFDVLTGQLLEQHAAALPDLSRVVVLMPHLHGAGQLRQRLSTYAAQRGHPALLGPQMATLRTWLQQHLPGTQRTLSNHARELMLVEALNQHRSLFNDEHPWVIAENLIQLFDELTLHSVAMPASYAEFIQRLSAAYRLHKTAPHGLSLEAKLIHSLWQAWHSQQHAEESIDQHALYLKQLRDSLVQMPSDLHFYALGLLALNPTEKHWLKTLHARGQLSVLAQGQLNPHVPAMDLHPDAPISRLYSDFGAPTVADSETEAYTHLLNQVYAVLPATAPSDADQDHSLRTRSLAFGQRYPNSPAQHRLSVYTAKNFEEEAVAIDIQVRRWLLAGMTDIGIVTEDRRLARRLRALLERANISLNDYSGWALSTTSAAATLERWLQAVEEDYAYHALIDTMRSPFITLGPLNEQILKLSHRLEQDIILHGNIHGGLSRYRAHIQWRERYDAYKHGDKLRELLEALERAAAPLIPVIKAKQPIAPQRFLEALQHSLELIGMTHNFAHDAAGLCLLEELKKMRQALKHRTLHMLWPEFRAWLGTTLERYNFRPPMAHSPVAVLNFEQSATHSFGAVIIAAADAQHLALKMPTPTFFNAGVRQELGLPDRRQHAGLQFYYFRRLLEASPHTLITHRLEENNEPLSPSPWLECLQSFHVLAYDQRLFDQELAQHVAHPGAHIQRGDDSPLPVASTVPAPALTTALIPTHLSATSYQNLMDCPYRFFSQHGLRITAAEPIKLLMEKADYGQKIHTILHVFHHGKSGSTEAYSRGFDASTRNEAIQALTELSEKYFDDDIKENIIHRDWFNRWQKVIPQYIDWQIEHHREWRIQRSEVVLQHTDFHRGLNLEGRIDRIDQGSRGLAIIDYKTGRFAKEKETLSGEAVQLPFYALLAGPDTAQVEFLQIDKDKVKSAYAIEGEDLDRLRTATAQTLKSVIDDLYAGAALPAWGDEQACRYCAYAGLCRKQAWDSTQAPALTD